MNAEATPQNFHWDAAASVMVPDAPKRADRQYVDGEHYRLGVIEERSANSHNHYFAALWETWANLPEDQAARFPTPEHLRKWALIQAGFYTVSDFACASPAEAIRLAAFIKSHDPYIVTVIDGATVNRLEAKSQSRKAMSREEFQHSKEAVLDVLAALIGTSKDALSKASAA